MSLEFKQLVTSTNLEKSTHRNRDTISIRDPISTPRYDLDSDPKIRPKRSRRKRHLTRNGSPPPRKTPYPVPTPSRRATGPIGKLPEHLFPSRSARSRVPTSRCDRTGETSPNSAAVRALALSRGHRSPVDHRGPTARRTHDRHAPEPTPTYPSLFRHPVMRAEPHAPATSLCRLPYVTPRVSYSARLESCE